MTDDHRVILHIGAGKSGSSAIQSFLRENVGALKDRGIVVPAQDLTLRPRISGHSVFALQKFFEKRGEGLFKQLDGLMGKIGDARLLISAENMSNAQNQRFFAEFCERYPTKVVFYIRRQDDFLASAWQQWHSKVRSDLDGWLDDALESYGHWLRTIRRWERIVGVGNVVPRIFERQSLPGGDVIRDFIDVLALDPTGLIIPTGDVNPSYSNLLTAAVAGRRDLFEGPHDDAFYRFVASLSPNGSSHGSGSGDGSFSLLSRAQRERIMTHYAEENETIRRRFFRKQNTLFTPIDHARYRYIDEHDPRDAQIAMLLDIVSQAFKSQKPEP